MPKTRVPSPARSQGTLATPRRNRSRRSYSMCSPAPSNASGRLTALVKFNENNMDSLVLSPMNSRLSVLTDTTEVEEPKRKSWWKKLEENSRDVLEVLEHNDAVETNNILDELDMELLSQEKKNYSVDLPDSSDSESICSIVIPQRKLFTQKENLPQNKFSQLVGTRESMAKINKTSGASQDKTLKADIKTLFGQGAKRSKPVFPAGLLNISNNATADKTKEMALKEPRNQVRNIFGNRPATKRKNMFADFVASESEDEIPEIQPKILSFPKKIETRVSSTSRTVRQPSLTANITNDIEMDEWMMLPSSTMVENQLEDIVDGSTPVKKAKLSKLSEMQGSKIGTNIAIDIEPKHVLHKSSDKLRRPSYFAENKQIDKELHQDDSEHESNSNHEEIIPQTDEVADDDENNFTLIYDDENKATEENDGKKSIEKDVELNKTLTKDGEVNTEEINNEMETDIQGNIEGSVEHNVEDEIEEDQEHTRAFTNKDKKKNELNRSQSRKQNESELKKLNESVRKNVGGGIQSKLKESLEQNNLSDNDDKIEDEQLEQNVEEEDKVEQDNDSKDKNNDQQNESHVDVSNEQNEEEQNESDVEVSNEQNKEEQDESDVEVSNEQNEEEQNESDVEVSNEQNEEEQNESDVEVSNEQNEEEHNESQVEISTEQNEEEQIESEVEVINEQNEERDDSEVEDSNEQNEEQNESKVEDSNEQNEEEQNESGVEVSNEQYEEEQDDSEVEDSNEQNEEEQNESEVEVSNEQNVSEVEEQNDSDEENEVEQNESHIEISHEKNNSAVEEQNYSDDENEVEHNESQINISNEQEMEVDNVEENDNGSDNEGEDSNEKVLNESVENNQSPQAINESREIAETPNTSHDTTGRYRKKNETQVRSPEAILDNRTNPIDSFIVQGRNTSIRKTKSIKNLNRSHSLAPVRESIDVSDGTKNSSAEGSGWDSHRTTRKTLRQTLGKDFTLRKSLRALVMEKSAKRHTEFNEELSDTAKIPQANSTEFHHDSYGDAGEVVQESEIVEESDHEASRAMRQTTLETYLQNVKKRNMEEKNKMEEALRKKIQASLQAAPQNHIFKVPARPFPRKATKPQSKPKTREIKLDHLPAEIIQDMKYKPPKRFRPSNASWITKRLYKFLETKLEPRYDYKARIRAEKLAETLYNFTKDLRRHEVAPSDAVQVLKHEMARLDVVRTHFDFYEFFHDFMPREIRTKVVPDLINKIPLPKHGVFTDILC